MPEKVDGKGRDHGRRSLAGEDRRKSGCRRLTDGEGEKGTVVDHDGRKGGAAVLFALGCSHRGVATTLVEV